MEQSEKAQNQYNMALKQLKDVNDTIYSMAILINRTQQILDERLDWIANIMGATDVTIDRLYLLIWHILFMLVAMVVAVFLKVGFLTRVAVTVLPPFNLAYGLMGSGNCLTFFELASGLIGISIGKSTLINIISPMMTF